MPSMTDLPVDSLPSLYTSIPVPGVWRKKQKMMMLVSAQLLQTNQDRTE